MCQLGFTYVVKSHGGINKLSQVYAFFKLIQLFENWVKALNNFSWQVYGLNLVLTDLVVTVTVQQFENRRKLLDFRLFQDPY